MRLVADRKGEESVAGGGQEGCRLMRLIILAGTGTRISDASHCAEMGCVADVSGIGGEKMSANFSGGTLTLALSQRERGLVGVGCGAKPSGDSRPPLADGVGIQAVMHKMHKLHTENGGKIVVSAMGAMS